MGRKSLIEEKGLGRLVISLRDEGTKLAEIQRTLKKKGLNLAIPNIYDWLQKHKKLGIRVEQEKKTEVMSNQNFKVLNLIISKLKRRVRLLEKEMKLSPVNEKISKEYRQTLKTLYDCVMASKKIMPESKETKHISMVKNQYHDLKKIIVEADEVFPGLGVWIREQIFLKLGIIMSEDYKILEDVPIRIQKNIKKLKEIFEKNFKD